MSHPIADQARDCLNRHLFSVAKNLLGDAIAQGCKDPDVWCEHLICESYFGNEEAAAQQFNKAQNAHRTHDLELLLSRYFYCRQLLAERRGTADHASHDWLKRHPYQPEPEVGIGISACLIVKNEASNLSACLASLEGIVDEIVVVDTGSTDNTVSIASSFGAVIGEFPWINDFSAARNHSLSLATQPWALWIDADETLDPACKDAFLKGVLRPHIGGYSIEIVNYLDDGGTTTEFIHQPTRLFRNIPGVAFSEPIHEQITPSLMAMGFPWTPLEHAKIHHEGYRQYALDEKNKVQRTLDILTAVVEKNPDDPFQLFNLANTYFVANDFERVVQIGKKCLQFLPKSGAEYGHAVFQIVITALDHLGRPAEGLAICDECDKTAYNGLINEYLRASVLLNLGRHDEALAACSKCLALDWPAGCIGDKGIADFRRHGLHAQLLGLKGDWKGALEQFDFTLSRQPGYLPALMGRAQAFENLGKLTEAKRDYLIAITDPRQVALCASGLGRIASAAGSVDEAATWFEQAWRVQLGNEEAFFAWAQLLDQPLAAFTEFENAVSPSPEYLLRKAQVLSDSAGFGDVVEAYAAALTASPSSSNGLFSFGDFLYCNGAYPEAVQAYEQALRLTPEYPQGWFVLGNGLAQMGHGDAAARCYQQALVLDPGHASAKANLELVSAAA